jgi:hypothetical protein
MTNPSPNSCPSTSRRFINHRRISSLATPFLVSRYPPQEFPLSDPVLVYNTLEHPSFKDSLRRQTDLFQQADPSFVKTLPPKLFYEKNQVGVVICLLSFQSPISEISQPPPPPPPPLLTLHFMYDFLQRQHLMQDKSSFDECNLIRTDYSIGDRANICGIRFGD